MVADEPLREERWRLLALGLYRAQPAGRRAGRAAPRPPDTRRRARRGPGPRPARARAADPGRTRPALAPPPARLPDGAGGQPRPRTGDARRSPLAERDGEVAAPARRCSTTCRPGHHGLLVLEGPAGHRQDAAARPRPAVSRVDRSVRVLSARGSQLESAFALRRRAAALRARARRRVACARRSLDGAAAGARGVFDLAARRARRGLRGPARPVLADGRTSRAADRCCSPSTTLQWCDGASLRFLAYLVRRLDSVPVLRRRRRSGRGRSSDHEELLAELAHEPDAVVLAPGAPVGGRDGGAGRASAGRPSRTALRHRLRADHAREPVPAAPAAAGARARTACGPTRPTPTRWSRSGPARSPAGSSCGCGGCPPTCVDVARAAAVLGDGAGLPAWPRSPGRRRPHTADALGVAGPRRDPPRRATGGVRAPAGARRGLPGAAGGGAGPAPRAGRRRPASGAAPATSRSPPTCCWPRPAATRSAVALLRDAARAAAGTGGLRERGDLPAPGAGRVADRPRDTGTWCCELGLGEARLDGIAAVDHLGRPTAEHDDPSVRAEIAVATRCDAGVRQSARGRRRVRPRGRRGSARRAGRPRARRWSRYSGSPASCTASTPTGARPPPDVDGAGRGARMLAATRRARVALVGADRERAGTPGPLRARGRPALAVDDGLFWVNAAVVRILCDDDVGDFWDRARAASHARGSLFAALSTSLWEGFWQWRRGELHEALACLRAALDQDRLWGGTRIGEPFARAFQIALPSRPGRPRLRTAVGPMR